MMSFRVKVLGTLTLLVIVVSYFSFNYYQSAVEERMVHSSKDSLQRMMEIFSNSIINELSVSGGKIFLPILQRMEKNDHVRASYVLDPEGRIVVSIGTDSLQRGTSGPVEVELLKKDLEIIFTRQSQGRGWLRAVLTLKNKQACNRCHGSQKETLGYFVLDYSAHELYENLALIEKFGIIYTAILLLVVFSGAFFMHYRSVNRSLKLFRTTIQEIEMGEMDARVEIEDFKELSKLGNNFNKMLNKLQKMQQELTAYHDREMLNAQKLATVGEMAAGLAHEIKNPLTGIANAIEIIVSEIDDEEKKPVLEEINRQVRRVNKTINDLLQFSRPIELHRDIGNLNQLIRSAVFFLESQVVDKDIKFSTRFASNIPAFEYDHKQIEDVLINLGQNAIQAIVNEGNVTICTEFSEQTNEVCVIIKDTGIGIEEENMSKIFKPFFTTRNKGTGLGLAITKDVIERHGGAISFSSNYNEGTMVTICLPLQPKPKKLSFAKTEQV